MMEHRLIWLLRFPNKWIGRQGPTQWPARAPDLNPLDLYLWGHLKAIVYSTPSPNVEILRQRIDQGCQQIRQTRGIWERVTRDSQ